MPLYKSMKNTKAFGRWGGVVDIVIFFIISFNFLIGFLGYIKYGDGVAETITLSLPHGMLIFFITMLIFLIGSYRTGMAKHGGYFSDFSTLGGFPEKTPWPSLLPKHVSYNPICLDSTPGVAKRGRFFTPS